MTMENHNRELYIVVNHGHDCYRIHCITDDKDIADSCLKTLQDKAKKDYQDNADGWDFDFPMLPYENKYKIEKANLNTFYKYHLKDEIL